MQEIVLETPYRFIPPTRGRIWPAILPLALGPVMRRGYGVTGHEVRGAEKLRRSLDAGHGIVLAGTHSRPCDPLACGWVTRAVHHPFYCMASWHTFMGAKLARFLIRRCGAYSIYREGADHASLNFTVDMLVQAERPVVIFAEGSVSRTNDRVAPLLDGMSFVARMAAKRGAKATPVRQVVIHPMVFKYFFQGDLEKALGPIAERLEARLGLATGGGSILTRARRLESALLALREKEYFGAVQDEGPEPVSGDRAARLFEHIVAPLEGEWSAREGRSDGPYARIQTLRSLILPDIAAGKLAAEELTRRRKQLADLYIAQSLACHPPNCLEGESTPEQIVEAIERIEEDLTDVVTPIGPQYLVIEVGDAVAVDSARQRGVREDPLVATVHRQLTELLQGIARPK
ncbi:MAG: 1-acyl-sn-glycerol-3-phosphate acyltransferase [Planctomycetia bacterium]|nr:1-acyl-sn-glycerol-3-phosphate acyltransferase [Planctomycetia bacterium]